MEIILSVRSPEGIEMLYSRILQNVSRLPAHERNMAVKAFTWVTYSGVTLSAPELEAALAPDGSRGSQSIRAFPAVLQWVSGDLIEVSYGEFPHQHTVSVANSNIVQVLGVNLYIVRSKTIFDNLQLKASIHLL